MELIVNNARQALVQSGVRSGDYLLVAVSGGIDSTVLLDVLHQLQTELHYKLHLVHFDHALRPESRADSRFVVEQARDRELPCSVERRDVGEYARAQKLSIEEAGRRLRYVFFEQAAHRIGAAFIALGHHAEDQAETVLLRLLRGSGTTGLGAMEVVRDGRYVRPLLGVRRREIEEYAREWALSYREDSSNRDLRFMRNRVRSELLPLLKEYNPNIAETLNRTARLLKDEDQLLSQLAQEAINAVICERYNNKIALDSTVLLNYHIALQRRVVRLVLQGLSATEGSFNFAVVEQVLSGIKSGDRRLRELGGKLRGQGIRSRYVLRWGRRPEIECTLAIPGAAALAGHGAEVSAEIISVEEFVRIRGTLGGEQVAFDADRLGRQVQLRSVQKGDRFQPLGMKGRKKVSDLLTDVKWPKILRDEILVLARDGEIAWVVPLRTGHRFKVDSTTRSVALCQFKRRVDDCAT